MSKVIHVDSSSFNKAVLENDKPVFVDFYADWCGPCKMIAPFLDELSIERDDILFVKVNVDENPEIAASFRVMSIPNMKVFHKGKTVGDLVGFMPKATLDSKITEILLKVGK